MRDAKSWIEAGAATHVGKVRQQNEDNYFVATRLGLWAVADGMGGHAAGDIASRTVVEELAAIAVPATASELLTNCERRIVSARSSKYRSIIRKFRNSFPRASSRRRRRAPGRVETS